MKLQILLAALASLAIAAPVAPAAAQRQAAAQRDWSRTIVQTPEGGYRMGSPNAQVKLVEFLSLTCPHCADFTAAGMPQLMPQVRSGRVSVEYRNFILNSADLAAAMLSRCTTPANYFRFSDAIMASQQTWMARVGNMPDVDASNPTRALQQLGRIASTSGLQAMAGRYGLTPAQARACMSNPRGLQRLLAMSAAAQRLGIEGTPTFMVNGRLVPEVGTWAELAPLLNPRR